MSDQPKQQIPHSGNDRKKGKGGGARGTKSAGRRGAGSAERSGVGVSPARAAAFELLERIGATDAHSDDLLHGPRLAGMSQVDRDLTTALVLGVLRWQIALDGRIRPLLSRPDFKVPAAVMIALRLGALQLLHMGRIPAHAALNESVELVRAAGQPQTAGMVNAVLRKLVGAGPQRKPLVEPSAAMAERLGHPLWLVQGWVEQYGRQAAEAVCAFNQQEPRCAAVFGSCGDGDSDLPVMDAGSRLVAEIAAAARPGARRVWDCCAAPGGKTMVLAQRLHGAEVLATDASPVRLKRLVQRLARALPDGGVRCELADATALPESFGNFDLVLCDVPCSGTGTLARNPEIRHRLRVEEIGRQAERQRRILASALGRLAPGGVLVYSTCSLEWEECEEVVETVLREAGAGVRRWDVEEVLSAMERLGVLVPEAERKQWMRGGSLRTLPGYGFEGDGFFAALLERV